MRRSDILESIASLMALGGVVLFGFCIFPCLNPVQWKFNFGEGYLPASVFSLPASLVIFFIAWRLSQQAQGLKDEETTKTDGTEPDTPDPADHDAAS